MKYTTGAALWALAAILTACSQPATNMPVQNMADPVASSTLQFAVGIATISSQGTTANGLNVVETLRQSNGLSATLYNAPIITGPSGFSITKSSISSNISPPITTLARADYGTNRITQQSLDASQATGYNQAFPFATTGAFGYGFCACNSNSGPSNGVAQLFHAYYLPIYAILPYGNQKGGQYLANVQYYGAPPAFPAPAPGLAQAGFTGYSIGFTDFAVPPVAGSYRLDVTFPPDFFGPNSTPTPQPSPSESPVPTLSATAQLKSLTGLPEYPRPQFTTDLNGGGTIVINAPAGVTETIAFIEEGQPSAPGQPISICNGTITTPVFYSFLVRGSGVHAITVPDSLGPGNTPTICSGSPYFVYAAGFDYPAFEAAYPQSTSVSPQITNGVDGQADVTTSDALTGTY